ncbi:MAG: ABC transporter substrate-binding protein [Rhizobium sp.]|nr:ABC transporter substrate-binding protein [Rhizobium sp.]
MKHIDTAPRFGAIILAALLAFTTHAKAQDRTLFIVLQEEPTSLDACDTNYVGNSRVLRNNITETLVNISPTDGSIVQGLATAWEQTSPTTWRFKLRPGVTFSDGTPFNTAAVANALARAQVAVLGCSIRGSKLGKNPYTATIVDDLTIDITGEAPDPVIPYRMSVLDIPSLATGLMDAKTEAPVGTGPYMLSSWDKGNSIKLSANPAYWGDKPAIPEVAFVWRAESAIRGAMIDAGEADLAFNIAPQDATTPRDVSFLNAEITFLRIDTQIAPFNDRRVREAVNLAIDRDALIGTIFHKDVQKSTQMILPSVVGYSADLKPWPHDPARAKALIEEARADGVPVDTEIVIHGRLNLYPNSTESMEAIQAMLTDAGFNVRLNMMETKVWLEELLKPFDDGRPPNLLQSQHDNTQGDAVFTIGPKYRSDGNQSTLADPEVDRLIDLGTSSNGPERGKAFADAFYRIEHDLIGSVPLFNMVGSVRVGDAVNYTPDVQTNNEIKLKSITFK